jgi:DNA repair exonuclease SbcCD nuclease subunit
VRVALLTDTHAGIRGDSTAFHDKAKLFYDKLFFPYLVDNGIGAVVHLGDIVDRRKYINYNSAARLRSDFLEPLEALSLPTYFIVGNHDCFFKSTNSVNALTELIDGSYSGFTTIVDRAEEINLDGLPLVLVPWINDENRKSIVSSISSTNARVALGHLELRGFEMYRGTVADRGDDPSLFGKFDLVCSGHYHHRSSRGNIHYLGSPLEFTWADCGDPRGFHILDTETLELEFIQNNYSMFEKIEYDDADQEFISRNIDWSTFSDKIIKVIVKNRSNRRWFDKFIENIEQENPISLQIVDDHLSLAPQDENVVDEAKSTIELCVDYIEEAEVRGVEKSDLKRVMSEIYAEAMQRTVV